MSKIALERRFRWLEKSLLHEHRHFNHVKSPAGAEFSSVIPMLGIVGNRESGSYMAFIGSLL